MTPTDSPCAGHLCWCPCLCIYYSGESKDLLGERDHLGERDLLGRAGREDLLGEREEEVPRSHALRLDDFAGEGLFSRKGEGDREGVGVCEDRLCKKAGLIEELLLDNVGTTNRGGRDADDSSREQHSAVDCLSLNCDPTPPSSR